MKQDRIDNYILGEMSNEERLAFEQEISQDKNLQEEVALQRDIVRAIRLKAAKEHLQAVEREIQAKEQREMQAKERRRQVFIVKLSNIARAVAACLIIGVIAGSSYYYVDKANKYEDYIQTMRCENLCENAQVSGFADQAYIAIQAGEYNEALNIITEGKQSLLSSTKDSLLTEDGHQWYITEQDRLQWYEALAYMGKGRWIKARRLLKNIAKSDSFYRSDANRLLEEL